MAGISASSSPRLKRSFALVVVPSMWGPGYGTTGTIHYHVVPCQPHGPRAGCKKSAYDDDEGFGLTLTLMQSKIYGL